MTDQNPFYNCGHCGKVIEVTTTKPTIPELDKQIDTAGAIVADMLARLDREKIWFPVAARILHGALANLVIVAEHQEDNTAQIFAELDGDVTDPTALLTDPQERQRLYALYRIYGLTAKHSGFDTTRNALALAVTAHWCLEHSNLPRTIKKRLRGVLAQMVETGWPEMTERDVGGTA